MDEINRMMARLNAAGGLAGTLVAGFDAFEVIRAAARDCEDRAPELFAAFLLAAGAAVEGRNALAGAPSLRGRGEAASPDVAPLSADVGEITDALAALAGVLASCLREAAGHAADAMDGAACQDATRAAAHVQQLLGAGDDAHVR
ncbi:MAG: hypothetical protein ACM3ML_20450 [Micromonosporaceae bacterium]